MANMEDAARCGSCLAVVLYEFVRYQEKWWFVLYQGGQTEEWRRSGTSSAIGSESTPNFHLGLGRLILPSLSQGPGSTMTSWSDGR
jgi:hypothetical protein